MDKLLEKRWIDRLRRRPIAANDRIETDLDFDSDATQRDQRFWKR